MDDRIIKARSALRNADAILIGASNGLSISEGYNIFADNDMFRQHNDFLTRWHGKRLVLLELGIGSRNRLIKLP